MPVGTTVVQIVILMFFCFTRNHLVLITFATSMSLKKLISSHINTKKGGGGERLSKKYRRGLKYVFWTSTVIFYCFAINFKNLIKKTAIFEYK